MRNLRTQRRDRGAGRAVHHPLFARFYDAVNPAMERAGLASLRRELLEGLRGEVIEVGAGSGASFPHYPREVTRVVAVEPEPHLRRLARERADTPRLRRVQRVLDATVWPLLAGGCHTHRDTLATLEAAGFAADRVERFQFPDGPVALPTSPHIATVASR